MSLGLPLQCSAAVSARDTASVQTVCNRQWHLLSALSDMWTPSASFSAREWVFGLQECLRACTASQGQTACLKRAGRTRSNSQFTIKKRPLPLNTFPNK